jgi:thymidine kinase
VVGIDEAQFFDDGIVDIAQQLAESNAGDRRRAGHRFSRRAIWLYAGLYGDRRAVDKLQAICMVCGEPASRTQRLVNNRPAHYNDPVVIVGASELYEARCRKHHEVPRD